MKKLFSTLVLFIGLTIVFPAFSQDKDSRQEPKFKKQKSYSKSYNLSSGDKIILDNQFGEMKLITWDKNEIKVDVAISAASDDEASAQKILDKISIQDEKNSSGVIFKTKLGDNDKDHNDKAKNDKNKHRNQRMRINYIVYLPSGNRLDAKNQFGAMIVPDYRGEATLESQFGSLTTGKITNAKNIKVAFGRANIEQVNNGKLDLSYTSGSIIKLVGNIDVKLQFCPALKIHVDNDVKSLDIDNSYSTLYMELSKNLSASYDISTNYGSFKNKSLFKIDAADKDDKRGFNPTTKYSGKSGNGGNKISVHSSFGSITAGHDLQVDTSGKKKSATI